MTPVELIRDMNARTSAIRRYAQAHDHWSDEEQIAAAEGRTAEAEGAHEFALLCLRAYRHEIDNPESPERIYIVCSKPHCPVCG